MPRLVALDTNLALLLVVGRVSIELIPRHSRLSAFDPIHYVLLVDAIGEANILATPNSLSEVSNLLAYRVNNQRKSRLMAELRAFAEETHETYLEGAQTVRDEAFQRLGLTDVAWLQLLSADSELLTDDLGLYLEAVRRGLTARNFNHLREERGV